MSMDAYHIDRFGNVYGVVLRATDNNGGLH
jgi:hypothetical protein